MEDVEAACTVPAGRLAEFIKHIAAINRVKVAMSRFGFFMGFSFLGWVVCCYVIDVYILAVAFFIFERVWFWCCKGLRFRFHRMRRFRRRRRGWRMKDSDAERGAHHHSYSRHVYHTR